MYAGRAALYDLIYNWKDYAAEAALLAEILAAHGVAPGARILEAACGTGNHLLHLRGQFAVAGFDLHDEMLAVARPKLPGVPLFQADMTALSVREPYDALLCLFSSIGNLCDTHALRAAAAAFARALRPGGVLLVEPWFTAEQWDDGRPTGQLYSTPDLVLARVSMAGRDGDLALFDLSWLVAARGRPVEHFVERHRMWLCPRETMRAAFEEAGFKVHFDPDGLGTGRGLFIGQRN